MAKAQQVSIEVVVAGTSVRGDQLVLSLAKGAIEVDRSSHPDLDRIGAGTRVKVTVTQDDKEKLDAGNVVPGVFQEVAKEPPKAAPRSSDSRSS